MLLDWTNVAIVGLLFVGLIMAVLSAVYAADRILTQLEAMQAAAQQLLADDDEEAERPRDRGLINGSQAGFQIRRPTVSGSGKRR